MLRAIYLTSTGNQIMRIILFLLFGWKWQTWGLVLAFIISQLVSITFSIVVWEKESRRLAVLAA
jgi:hypothetical protein